MTIYLGEDELGRSTDAVGFPNLRSCHAIMLQTSTAMYGLHVVPTDDLLIPEFAAALGSVIRIRESAQDGLCLFGCCDFTRRFGNGGEQAWRSELQRFGRALGFSGQAAGFDTGTIDPGQAGSYVEYRYDLGKTRCMIYYRKHNEMQYAVANRSDMPNYSNNILKWKATERYRHWKTKEIQATDLGAWQHHTADAVTFSAQANTPNTGLIELDYGLRLKTFFI